MKAHAGLLMMIPQLKVLPIGIICSKLCERLRIAASIALILLLMLFLAIYRLLAGLIYNLDRSSGPMKILDIGTHLGTSARTMLDFSDDEDTVVTFDVNEWTSYPTTYLTEEDFSSGKLVQHIEDLQQPQTFARFAKMLCEADFIMCDGPKDGVFERKFYSLLSTLDFPKKQRWLFLDDIRFPSEMISWRIIDSPKIDLTSFGHFSGTGLVNISEGFKFG